MSETLSTARPFQPDKRSKIRFLLPLAVLVAVLLAACGGSDGISEVIDPEVGSGDNSSGDLAPDFTITMFQGQDVVGGQQVNFSDLFGEKPIVLNFWAGLCPPCRAEMPDLQEFNEEFKDRALLIGIDLGQFTGLGTPDEAQDLLDELEVTYPAGYSEDGSIIGDYRVLGMPTTVFIDAKGEIFNKWTGALNGSVLEEMTLEMLAQ